MSAFWKLYASVTDDVRHKLVEEGWFGRPVTGNTTEQDMPGIAADSLQPPPTHSLYAEVWGKEPKTVDLYGNAPAVGPTPTIEPPAEPERGKGLEPEL